MFLCTWICILVAVIAASDGAAVSKKNKFPKDFLFGVATSAYQIEGGWNADGKGPSIWDEFVHVHPDRVKDQTNADVGPNSYELFMKDIEAIKNLNMDYYRFSIAWSRILPTGDISNVNEKGIEYYNKLIDNLLANGIKPMITMYHWDLPLELQKLGGFTNSAIVNYFEAYANLLFKRFGDRVKYWITFNEPYVFCMDGYGSEKSAPGMNIPGVGEYLCGHNVLKAHAVVYHLYQKSYHRRYRGKVGITLNSPYFYSDKKDKQLVDRALQFQLGWFASPIFSRDGDYPDVMVKRINKNSKREGRLSSRLPEFSKEWIKLIRGSADFLGLNYYTSRYIDELSEPKGPNPSFARDRNLEEYTKPEWKRGASEWLYSVPEGLGDILRWIKKEYKNPPVYITENGWSDEGELEDVDRVQYLRDHLEQVQDVLLNTNINLKGYTVWSVIDNFEWASGYTEKFGLYKVDMDSELKERVPKKSVEFLKLVTTTRRIPDMQ